MRPARSTGAVAALVAVTLAGCAAPHAPQPGKPARPPPALTAPYAASATAGANVYRLDGPASQVLVLVGKAGPLAGFGHRHAIVAGNVRGFAIVRSDGSGRTNLVFPVRALRVDPPAVRQSLGGDYAKTLDAGARSGTRKHMLGKSVLDAARYPWIGLAATAAAGNNPRGLDIRVTLHGQTHEVSAPARLLRDGPLLAVDGDFAIRQTAFGITPYSAALGGLRVKDTLHIRYHLMFVRWCGGHEDDKRSSC